MSAPSETHSDDLGNLGDSSYDFVDSEEESRDGNTESIASTEYSRPDDVASLADTEQSDNEDSGSERSHITGGIPTFNGLDGPAHTPALEGNSGVFLDDVDRTLAHSIEFEEPLSLSDENVSVKHTVADFNEEETAKIAQNMMLQRPPKRLVATIRQTMTRQGLSTKEPLRILYVGCHTAKQDIIRKIASSVAASVSNGRNAGPIGHRSSQLFHVVPITAFGSEKPPEIELMQSSGYQINVEDCSDAVNIKFEDESKRPDILRIILGDNYAYNSIPHDSGFVLEPAWELPHVAIFYCSGNDTFEMKRVRTVARIFMHRHNVPSIVISHKQLFEKSLSSMTLDQHAIHMCLESRDPNGPRNIIHQRLPIDLDSFKTIDARQMNRHLAFLTGLHEPLNPPYIPGTTKVVCRSLVPDIEKTSSGLADSVSFVRTRTGPEWRAFLPVGLLILSVLAAAIGNWKYRYNSAQTVSINGNIAFTEPTTSVSTTAAPSTVDITASLMTSTETRTSTRTITVVKSETPVSNSLATMPSMENGKFAATSPTKQASKKEGKKTLCSAEILGDREILIRIPESTKLSWLTKESMSVNMSRESGTVEAERVYTTADGIILKLAKEAAHGILNISIVTTRRPKINETFMVDFGQDWKGSIQGMLPVRLRDGIWNINRVVESEISRWWKYAETAMAESDSFSEVARQRLEEANRLATEKATESGERFTKAAKEISMGVAKWSAILSKEVGMQVSDVHNRIHQVHDQLRSRSVREPLEDTLLRAQIQSRLYWLKLQGKDLEYAEYEKRAAKATKRRAEEAAKARQQAEDRARKMKHRCKRGCQKGKKGIVS